MTVAALAFACAGTWQAGAQAQSYNIPLSLVSVPAGVPGGYPANGLRLQINVGINGGAPQPYLFDTGSAVFNAAYNPTWWGGVPSSSSLPQNIQYCYDGTSGSSCRGFTGNLVQVPSVSFYAPGVNQTGNAVATFAANPGYVVNAAYQYILPGSPTYSFPSYFSSSTTPFFQGLFNGVFGAGNFATLQTPGVTPPGGVLGQTTLSGVTQGYVVAANGQVNPASSSNPPQQANAITVAVGGQTQPVTSCSPCVTVGLTPQVIGQFAPVGPPGTTGQTGVVPVQVGNSFNNPNQPYNASVPATGNNGSTVKGATFAVSLTPPGGSAVTATGATLLDSGTPDNKLSQALNQPSVSSNGNNVNAGVTLATGASVPGLTTTTAVLTNNASASTYNTYNAGFSNDNTNVSSDNTNVLGISFFLQNSVMFDLSDNVIGYTPFFVTTANLATMANGPLIVGSSNVPLGLAGSISGPGGVTVNSGGALQLSGANTYTGLTTIAAASGGFPVGQLLISGPGSLASSAGVVDNGIFDISRAWSPVAIQTLSGSGQVNLGGQNLVITNGSTTFSGTLSDGGSYPATGGVLTIAGGSFTLAGSGSQTGGTLVSGGTFTLTGTLSGNVAVQPQGTFVDNGLVAGSVANAGTLSGTGMIAGSVANFGMIVPGNGAGGGTLGVGGNYAQSAGGTHLAQGASNGQSNLLRVGGAALLGGTVSVYAQPGTGYGPRTTWRIVNATGGLAGAFSSVIDPYPFLQSSLSYDANNAYLTVQVGGFGQAAANLNQYAVGRVLDANVNTASGDFAQVLSSMASSTQSLALGQATLTSLGGQNYSSFSSTMVQGLQLFMSNFANQTGGGSPVSNRVALAEACEVACDITPPAVWGAWGGALGGLGTIGANAVTGAVTYNVGGFAAGLDRLVAPGLRVGVTTGYTTGTQWTGGFSGNGTTDTFLAGLYGNFREGRVYADAVAGYAYSYNQMWRQIFIPGLQQRLAQGRTGANQWYGQVEGGYRIDIGPLGSAAADAYITPFMRWQGYTGTQKGFTETGAQSLNLTVAGQTTNSLRSVLGAQLGGAIDLGWREKLALQFRLGWSHEYASTARPVTATLGGAPLMPFTTWGIAPTRDGALVGFSANTAIADGTSVYLRYEGNLSGSDSAHALTAGVRMTW